MAYIWWLVQIATWFISRPDTLQNIQHGLKVIKGSKLGNYGVGYGYINKQSNNQENDVSIPASPDGVFLTVSVSTAKSGL